MSGALTKRQQARNEKVLQDILHSVPGNNFCADCQARNPSWASWSLGIFLCMRCAAIHRKLGTHISKVKSLSMDSWSNEQVENMRKVGNAVSNKNYNPSNKLPPVPIDVDEADSAMERFIRQKYINRGLSTTARHNTGSTESDETPPPLPPKTPSRFGFRSASSIFPLGNKAKKAARDLPSPRDAPTSPRRGKMSSESDSAEDIESKLAKLRDMGFGDQQRNAIVLKGVNGNLERAIEALVRLGEGDKTNGISMTSTAPRQQQQNSGLSMNRATTPRTSGSGQESVKARPLSPSNPFDMLDMPQPPQPLSSQSTGTLQNRNPFLAHQGTNPFGIPPQASSSSLHQAFQSMSLAAPTQPLFPHHTGGMVQQQAPQVLYQQPMTPPIPSTSQGFMNFASNQTYPQPQRLQPAPTGSYNPFFAQQAQEQQQQQFQSQLQVQQPQQPIQQQQQQPLTLNTAYGTFGNNPFARSPTRIQSPTLTQIPEQSQPAFFTPTPPAQAQINNPFFAQQTTMSPVQGLAPQPTGYVPQQQQVVGQGLMGQMQAGQAQGQQMGQQGMFGQRPDKASIMALYNYPQPSSPLSQVQQQQPSTQTQGLGQPATQGTAPNPLYHAQTFPLQQSSQVQQQPQSNPFAVSTGRVASPGPGNNNPFLSNSGITVEAPTSTIAGMNMMQQQQQQMQPQAQQQQPQLLDFASKSVGNRSRDSVMASGFEWTNGRHSPDAFTSLSARDVR